MVVSNTLQKGLLTGLLLVCIGCSYGQQSSPLGGTAGGPQIQAKSPGIMRSYSSFYVSDVQAYTIDGDYLRRVDDNEVRILAEDFRRKLIDNLGSKYSVIPQPSRNTAIIKVALTDVATNYAAFQLVPGMVIPNAMRGGASIQATVMDSVSREPLVTMRDSRSGERQGFFSGLGKWDGAQRAFDEWAQMLAAAVSE